MGRVVAISGGDFESTEKLNKYAIKMTDQEHVNVLFIGTASEDAEGYIRNLRKSI